MKAGFVASLRAGILGALLATQVAELNAVPWPETSFNVGSEDALDQLLLGVGAQARVSILFPEEVRGVRLSEPFMLKGSFHLNRVLDQLLKGTGYTYVRLSSRVIAVRKQTVKEKQEKLQPAQEINTIELTNVPPGMEEVFILGQLLQKNLTKTPTSVSAFDEQIAADRNYVDLFDSFQHLPNVTKAFEGTEVAIRGVTLRGPANVDSGNLSSIFIDGIPLYTQGLFSEGLPLWDVAQVEVHRGPQSVSFGRNAMAGAINMVSNIPTFTLEGQARMRAGSHGSRAYQAAVGGPVLKNKVAVRLSASRQRYDGAAFNATLNDSEWNKQSSDFIRGQVLIEPQGPSGMSLLLSGSFYEDITGRNSVTLESGKDRISYANVDSESTRKNYFLSAHLEIPVCGSCLLTNLSAFKWTDGTGLHDSDNAASFVDGLEFEDSDTSLFEDASYYQDLRFTYVHGGVRAMVGLHYDRVDLLYDFRRNSLFETFALLATKKSENLALMFEVSADVTERLNIAFGGRLDHDEADYVLDGRAVNIASAFFLPSLEIVYELDNGHFVGFSAKKGGRSGGVFIHDDLLSTYDPEYTWNFELSHRARFMDDTVSLRTNVFYTSWYNQQSVFQADGGLFGVENRGGSELYGLEFEASAQVKEGLEVFVSYGHLSTSVDAAASAFLPIDSDAGNPDFRYAPRHTVSAGLTYQHASGFGFSFDGGYQSGAFTEEANTENTRLDGRILVNARAYYAHGTWRLSAYMDNVFDTYYLLANTDFMGRFGAVGKPRLIGLSLEKKF